ncbi:MAG: DUF2271 domain-containing protein [Planctomycetota bacterium]
MIRFDSTSPRSIHPLLSPLAVLLGLLSWTGPDRASGEEYQTFHEHILGTSLELVVNADSAQSAAAAERGILEQIDRFDSLLSRYRSDSEFARWLATDVGTSFDASKELRQVLRHAQTWRERTDGAFDIRSGELERAWKQFAGDAQRWNAERKQLVGQMSSDSIKFFGTAIVRTARHQISLDGLAKGYILDQVAKSALRHSPRVSGVCINLGGDIRVAGDMTRRVGVTDPNAPSENADPLATVVLQGDVAIATSGTYRRQIRSAGQSATHLFDPRTGLPCTHVLGATVVASTATAADALATALCVMTPIESLSLINSLAGVECLIVTSRGVQCSVNWPSRGTMPSQSLVSNKEETKEGLHVWFRLNRPKGGRYRRPYVAVWLEDTDGFPVKTAVLWLQTERPGPRWHRDLTRWYRNDRMRKLAEKKDLIGTISGATRGPGEYEAHFDGTDNAGKALPDGEYTLCIEAAREKGTYQIIRERVRWGEQAIGRKQLKTNIEVDQASYQFTPKSQ